MRDLNNDVKYVERQNVQLATDLRRTQIAVARKQKELDDALARIDELERILRLADAFSRPEGACV